MTYHLHPTFTPKDITVSKAPFLLSRIGWGYFDVEFDVEFQPWTGLGTRKMVHELCLEGKGKTQAFLIDVDLDKAPDQDEQKLAAEALASELERLKIQSQK